MDYAHHDPIHSHRVYSLQAVERRLNHHVTMMGNQVMMMVIHTLRLTQGDKRNHRKTVGADSADEHIHPAMTQIGVRIQKFIYKIGPYFAVQPPSITSAEPVTKAASSEAR